MISFLKTNQFEQHSRDWYSLIDSLFINDHSSIVNEFISAFCQYLKTEQTTQLKEITHIFVEFCIVGKKDFDTLNSLFGSCFLFIKQIIFDINDDLIDQQKELLSLLKFFVKTGLFNNELVNDNSFVHKLFILLDNQELFIKTSILLESILERRKTSFPIQAVPTIHQTFHSLSYLHLGAFLPVLNYLVHNTTSNETVNQNCKIVIEHNFVQKLMDLFSLSTVHLAIIYLVQNESIDESDSLVKKFKEYYQGEIETYPDVDIQFEGAQGLYAADVCTNILFLLSCICETVSNRKDREQLLISTKVSEVLYNLYDCMAIEHTLKQNTQNTIHHSLFYQFAHFVSFIPSSILFNTFNGLEFIEVLLYDIADESLQKQIVHQLICCIEAIVRESSIIEKENLGTEKQFIQLLLHLLGRKEGANENRIELELEFEEIHQPKHIIFDLLGSLLRGSRKNSATFFSFLQSSFGTFLSYCSENCIESSVLFRALILNFLVDKMDIGKEEIVGMIKKETIVFFKNLVNFLGIEGISSHTTCCLNTAILILGIYSSNISELIDEQTFNKMKDTLTSMTYIFKMKYHKQEVLEELCSITQTSENLWKNALSLIIF